MNEAALSVLFSLLFLCSQYLRKELSSDSCRSQ